MRALTGARQGRRQQPWAKPVDGARRASSACTATWRRSTAVTATGEIAVSERAGRGEVCPLSGASEESDR